MTIIKKFADSSTLEFGRGKFDEWCVFLTRPNLGRKAPLDIDYFNQLVDFGSNYGASILYLDFVQVYDHVRNDKKICQTGHNLITSISEKYHTNDQIEIDILFTILYAAMVAEEKKSIQN